MKKLILALAAAAALGTAGCNDQRQDDAATPTTGADPGGLPGSGDPGLAPGGPAATQPLPGTVPDDTLGQPPGAGRP
jgi:hypothetical protein